MFSRQSFLAQIPCARFLVLCSPQQFLGSWSRPQAIVGSRAQMTFLRIVRQLQHTVRETIKKYDICVAHCRKLQQLRHLRRAEAKLQKCVV